MSEANALPWKQAARKKATAPFHPAIPRAGVSKAAAQVLAGRVCPKDLGAIGAIGAIGEGARARGRETLPTPGGNAK